ncbi:MAG TPA: cell division protein FtsH, partial [Bacteroides sp.]|nr:cell division protein FtsH [Bacteroides sp.]
NRPYSEKTAETIDEEVKKLIDSQYKRAKEILQKNRDGLNKLAELLLEREVIFSDDLEKIFGKRPWATEEPLPERPGPVPGKKQSAKSGDEKTPAEEEKVK